MTDFHTKVKFCDSSAIPQAVFPNLLFFLFITKVFLIDLRFFWRWDIIWSAYFSNKAYSYLIQEKSIKHYLVSFDILQLFSFARAPYRRRMPSRFWVACVLTAQTDEFRLDLDTIALALDISFRSAWFSKTAGGWVRNPSMQIWIENHSLPWRHHIWCRKLAI